MDSHLLRKDNGMKKMSAARLHEKFIVPLNCPNGR
jgi:hypothetical protein